MQEYTQTIELFLLAFPIAFITWIATHSKIFSEPREYLFRMSKQGDDFFRKKLFHMFTCENCFSNYITAIILFLTGYKFIASDWRGYFVAAFSLVWLSKLYMGLYTTIRHELTKKTPNNGFNKEE